MSQSHRIIIIGGGVIGASIAYHLAQPGKPRCWSSNATRPTLARPRRYRPARSGRPVQPERRCIFAFTCPTDSSCIPLVIDPDGVFVRPEHKLFIAGGHATPVAGEDPHSLEVDYEQFNDVIWPELANRIPAFESIRLSSAWAGHYEMNTFDHNAIIGWAPATGNLLMATGFSGHGMQHSPAAGRGVAELITQGRYTTLDLSHFAPERIAANEPIVELNVI